MPFSPLLAFGFASPWLLWGLTAAGAPILIHLLNRRKFKETSWAAMKFLLEAIRKNQRRLQLEQWLLLALRTLLVLLLVIALARPFAEQLSVFFRAGEPAHKIVVIDATMSMGYRPGDAALFERAKQIARDIVVNSHPGDAFNVVRVSNLPPTVIVQNPSYQPADVAAEIDQLQLPYGRGDVLAMLRKTLELFPAAPLRRKEVYFISDFQRATWAAGSAEELSELRTAFRKLADDSRLTCIDIGQSPAENVAVTDFRMQDPFVMISRPTRFTTTLRNFGLQPATGRNVELLVDGRVVQQKRITLPPGGEVSESFSHTFVAGGEHALQLRVSADHLPLDDQRWLAVPVKDQLQVLCVSGKNTGQPMGKATDYLELALAPPTSNAGPRLILPRVVNEGELLATDLSRYDCLFLCNVRMFTPREADVLEAYLRGGGGVVWCLGDGVLPDSYNRVLYRDGKGILPARLGDRRGNLEVRQAKPVPGKPDPALKTFDFDPGEFTHPIIQVFRGNPDAGLQTTRTYAHFATALESDSPARAALKFDSGDGAIIEKSVGRGKAILITTSVDDQWGNWAVWPSFLPLIQETVLFAVSGRWGERQHLVGEPLAHSFAAPASDVDISVRRPDGRTLPVHATRNGQIGEFTFDDTAQSGMYEVTYAHPLARTELYAVNTDPRESDLTKFVQDELEGELLKGIDFRYHTEWAAPEAEASTPVPDQNRSGLTRWLLYIVLYLLLVEQMLSWNFRYGLWMLCPILLPLHFLRRRAA